MLKYEICKKKISGSTHKNTNTYFKPKETKQNNRQKPKRIIRQICCGHMHDNSIFICTYKLRNCYPK